MLEALKLIVFQSLSQSKYENLTGWIRSNEAVDAIATLEQVNRLQSENDALRQKLERFPSAPDANAIAAALGDKARQILGAAAKGNGTAIRLLNDGIYAGQLNLPFAGRRQLAEWKHVLDELSIGDLVQIHDNDIYLITHLGYLVGDEVNAQARAIPG